VSKSLKPLVEFLEDLIRRRKLLPNRLAKELGINHSTISRWLSGKSIPSVRSCWEIAQYCRVPIEDILIAAGYIPGKMATTSPYPEFREYIRSKYSEELDEDLIIMVEDFIERKRAKIHSAKSRDKKE
jgi:transcriptional regulator with XRE-family HTH domain